MKPLHSGLLSVFVTWSIATGTVWAAPESSIELAKAATGRVVARSAGNEGSVAAAFLFSGNDLAVTCLHVVAGASEIDIAFPEGLRKGSITRVLRASDLALIKLDRPIAARPLKAATSLPAPGEPLEALGFAQGMLVPRSKAARRPATGAQYLKELVVLTAMRQAIQDLGYPSLDAEIIDIESSIEPSMSGGPLLNAAGAVVGINNGGLERGATEITWAMPVSKLAALLVSDERAAPSALVRPAAGLFTTTTTASAEAEPVSIRIGDRTFTLTKSRSLDELTRFADDQRGLGQLQQAFANLNPGSWRFDVYRESRSGATIVVPAGLDLTSSGNDALATTLNRRLSLRIRLTHYGVPGGEQMLSQQFEFEQLPAAPNSLWNADPSWTYFHPLYYPSGLAVRRKAFIRGIPTMTWAGPMRDPMGNILFQFVNGYTFLTFATYRGDILSVAAHRADPIAPDAVSAWESWGQMALAVQLATFFGEDRSAQARR